MFHVVVRLDSLRHSTLHCTLHSLSHLPFHSLHLHLHVGRFGEKYPVRFREWGIRHFGRQHPSHRGSCRVTARTRGKRTRRQPRVHEARSGGQGDLTLEGRFRKRQERTCSMRTRASVRGKFPSCAPGLRDGHTVDWTEEEQSATTHQCEHDHHVARGWRAPEYTKGSCREHHPHERTTVFTQRTWSRGENVRRWCSLKLCIRGHGATRHEDSSWSSRETTSRLSPMAKTDRSWSRWLRTWATLQGLSYSRCREFTDPLTVRWHSAARPVCCFNGIPSSSSWGVP